MKKFTMQDLTQHRNCHQRGLAGGFSHLEKLTPLQKVDNHLG